MWGGNVRELEHTIERAVARERGEEIQPERSRKITSYNPNAQSDSNCPTAHITCGPSRNLEKTYVARPQKNRRNQTKAPTCSKCRSVR